MPTGSETRRVDWLDGVRGAAALFVALHHTWHMTWRDFPENSGPWAVGWLLYGHLAVAVFIVVSGFSLTLSPLRHGDRLVGGVKRFIRRRAWRIIPAYWAALALSTVIYALVLEPDATAGTLARSVAVHGLLIQDIVPSVDPNGAFWSIAVEWQIYFLFPLILWLGRRTSFATAATVTALVVVGAHLVASLDTPLYRIDHLSPQFLALFAFGVLAAKIGHGTVTRTQRRLLVAAPILVLAAMVVAANTAGSAWIVERYFWVDLVFGVGTCCVLVLLTLGGAARTRRVLSSRAALLLGGFSYSLYLMHGPLLRSFNRIFVRPQELDPLLAWSILLAVGLPIVILLCYGFHLVFERPFLHYRSLGALREMPLVRRLLRARARPGVTSVPVPVQAPAREAAEAPASA